MSVYISRPLMNSLRRTTTQPRPCTTISRQRGHVTEAMLYKHECFCSTLSSQNLILTMEHFNDAVAWQTVPASFRTWSSKVKLPRQLATSAYLELLRLQQPYGKKQGHGWFKVELYNPQFEWVLKVVVSVRRSGHARVETYSDRRGSHWDPSQSWRSRERSCMIV